MIPDTTLRHARDPRTLLEIALKHERVVVTALLVLIPLGSWGWVVLLARDMYGPMSGASAWMMTSDWGVAHLLLLFAMWAVMMAAMMLPSAAPLILLYAGALRAGNDVIAARKTYVMTAGYLFVWVVFAVAATALQRLLSVMLMLDAMMEPATSLFAAIVVATAGVYQLTPMKRACLRVCRSPLSFMLQHWRPGVPGAFTLGVQHGAYCLGCCWALMLLLFASGVMNLLVIIVLTLWVLAEKFLPAGEQSARASGIAMLALAAWLAIR